MARTLSIIGAGFAPPFLLKGGAITRPMPAFDMHGEIPGILAAVLCYSYRVQERPLEMDHFRRYGLDSDQPSFTLPRLSV